MALTKVKINLGTEGNLSGSRSIIQSTKTLVSSSAQIASNISGSITSVSSSTATRVAANLASINTLNGNGSAQGVGTSDSPTFNDVTVTGTLTAQEVHTEFESASILFTSGSTKFGDSGDDIHNMTGSIRVSGSAANESFILGHNVGIGTNNPTVALEVFGSADQQIRIDSTGNRAQLQFDGKKTSDAEFAEINFANDGDSAAAIHAMRDGANDAARLAFMTQATGGGVTERMSIDSTGNVGIGTNSPTSTSQLHVEAALAEIRIKGTNDSQSDEVSHLIMEASSDRRAGITIEGDSNDIQAFMGRPYDSPNVLAFETDATERMRITSAGRVGIGFTAPETTLQVSGSIGSKLGEGGFISIIRKHASITAGDLLGAVRFGGEETDQQVGGTVQAKCDGVWATNDLPTRLEFLTTPDGAGDQIVRMTIKNTGRVGIGTDSPDGTLDVVKDGSVAQVRIKSTGSGDDALIDMAGISGKDSQVRFYEADTFRWRIRHKADQSNRFEISNASDVGVQLSNGGNSFSSLSDERIKENLIEITGATEKLNQLRCVNYNYTFDKERPHLGLLAQEVEKFYPEIVSGDSSKEIEEIVNDDGTIDRKNVMSIEYSSLIPVLVKSIQELTKRIEELEK